MDRAVDMAAAAGVDEDVIHAEVVADRAGYALVAAATEHQAGLIAIARSAEGPMSGLARWLARHAPCDLLLVAPGDRDPHAPYGRIVVASAGTSTSDRAARRGFDIARAIDAPVTLVFVGHPATGEIAMRDTDRDLRTRGHHGRPRGAGRGRPRRSSTWPTTSGPTSSSSGTRACRV